MQRTQQVHASGVLSRSTSRNDAYYNTRMLEVCDTELAAVHAIHVRYRMQALRVHVQHLRGTTTQHER